MSAESFFYVFDLLGTLVFAISGALAAVRKRLDVYGVFVLAIITALGGGIIRDCILGHTPPGALVDILYLAVTAAGALLVVFFHSFFHRIHHALRIMDAVGLGIFTVLGVQLTLRLGDSWYAAILMGIITGTGGGMLRDIMSASVPLVLRREIYAVASLAGAVFYVVWYELALGSGPWYAGAGAVLGAALCSAIRLLSLFRNWHLPRLTPR